MELEETAPTLLSIHASATWGKRMAPLLTFLRLESSRGRNVLVFICVFIWNACAEPEIRSIRTCGSQNGSSGLHIPILRINEEVGDGEGNLTEISGGVEFVRRSTFEFEERETLLPVR